MPKERRVIIDCCGRYNETIRVDHDLLVALCRWCHDQTDAPYERGRLVVTALGAGQFTFEVVTRVGPNSPPAGDAAFAHVGKNSALQR